MTESKDCIFNKVPSEYIDTYNQYFDLKWLKGHYKQKKDGFHVQYAEMHPVTFSYFMLGKKLRMYQAFAIDQILVNPKTALCWARRTGKSTLVAVLSLWMCYFNKYPKNAMERFTVIGIVSKENDAAKKLLAAVKGLIYDGDVRWYNVTKGSTSEERNHFSKRLTEPTNAEQITFHNKSVIKSFPPTKKVKGWGFSFLFIDEIAYLDPKEEDPEAFYSLTCMPTLADCGGKICIASTPAGCNGLFYTLFDPEDKIGTDYFRIQFSWMINEECETYKAMVLAEKDNLRKQGKEAYFLQEYEADFTVVQSSFFDKDDIDNYFDKTMHDVYEWHKSPCSVGIDFGISICRTTVTVKTKYQGKLITLYHRAFPVGFDNNLLMAQGTDDGVPNLCKRYDVQWLVPEESSISDMFVKWCKREGYPTFAYRFSQGNLGGKNTAYHTYRAMLKQEDYMKSYQIPLLREEMLGLQEIREKVNWIISKPSGGSDDCIDSDVYATTPFFMDEGSGWYGIGNTDNSDLIKKKLEQQKKGFDISTRNQRKDNGLRLMTGPCNYVSNPL